MLVAHVLALVLQILPPPPCLPVPIPSPIPCTPPPPLPIDAIPRIGHVKVVRPVPRLAEITWRASDDKGLSGFRVYRDGKLIGSRGPKARSVRVFVPCGKHEFWVQAVDTSNQGSAVRLTVRRKC